MIQPFQSLWATVLMAGLKDARLSAEGESWMWSPDFETVATLAGLDPEAVREGFYQAQDVAA